MTLFLPSQASLEEVIPIFCRMSRCITIKDTSQ